MDQSACLFPHLSKMALFLDFDGTLAPIQSDANAVHLSDGLDVTLLNLQKMLALGPIIISGRDIEDLANRVPNGLHRIGNHGSRTLLPFEHATSEMVEFPAAILEPLREIVEQHPGSFLERKTSIVAVHFRKAPIHAASLENEISLLPLCETGYQLERGKMIVELKPVGVSKGTAVEKLMRSYQYYIPVMIGDDTTDETAMKVAQDMGGIGVKVGIGPTCAKLRVNTVDDVIKILKDWTE